MGWALGDTDLERVGCSLYCEEGEEVGHGFCVLGSRIFPEVWVADFAWDLMGERRALDAPSWCVGRLGRDVCHYDSELCAQACFSKLS